MGSFARSFRAVLASSIALATAFLAHQSVFAADGDTLSPGDIAVSGFAGVKLQTDALPPNVDPATKTVIDPDGVTLTIFDGANAPLAGAGNLLDLPPRLSFTARQVGHVFALAFDTLPPDERGVPGLYAGATSLFGLNIIGPDLDQDGLPDRISVGAPGARFMEGQFGPAANGGAGAIWKIDQATGQLSLYADIQNSGPGLSGLAFDPRSRSLYAADADTGVIHQFSGLVAGNDVGQFDHGVMARPLGGKTEVADDGRVLDIASADFKADDPATWAVTQVERRVDALSVHGGRLYYAAADGPEIWSVGLTPDGSFLADPRIEFAVPLSQPGNVTAITFDGEGRMLLAIRNAPQNSGDFVTLVTVGPADVMRFTPEQPDDPQTPSAWLPDAEFYGTGSAPEHRDASGGLALQYAYRTDGSLDTDSCHGTLLASADALGSSLAGHGVQIGAANQFQPVAGQSAAADFVAVGADQDNIFGRGLTGGIAALTTCASDQASSAVAGGIVPEITGEGGIAFPPFADDDEDTAFPPFDDDGDVVLFPPVAEEGGGGKKAGTLTITKTAAVEKCSPKGGCAFNIEVKNNGPDIAGPIVIDELIEAPQAALTGEPNAPWRCSDEKPFSCLHPGPLPANGKLTMRVVFAPNLPPEAKEVRNCAVIAGAPKPGGEAAAAGACAAIALDPNAPVQPGPVIVSKRGASVCSVAGTCSFAITVQNTTDAEVKGPIEIDEQIDAPEAKLAGDPPAPWTCSKTAPFRCSHPGPMAAKSKMTLVLSFIPNVSPQTKQLKNCAIVRSPANAPQKKAGLLEDFLPHASGSAVQSSHRAVFTPRLRNSLLHFVDTPGTGNIGGVTNKCLEWRTKRDGFVVQQSNGFQVTFSNLKGGPGHVTGDATYINKEFGAVNGQVTGVIDAEGRLNLLVKWPSAINALYIGRLDAAGNFTGTTTSTDTLNNDKVIDKATLTGESKWWQCARNEICDAYTKSATAAAKEFAKLKCPPEGPTGRWARDENSHLSWCMAQPPASTTINDETENRRKGLETCRANAKSACQALVQGIQSNKAEFLNRKCENPPAWFSRDEPGLVDFCMGAKATIAALDNLLKRDLSACIAKQAAANEGGVGNDTPGGTGGKTGPLAPEQCAVVDIEQEPPPPQEVADGKAVKHANGLELTKAFGKQGPCTRDNCPFTFTIRNTGAEPVQGPLMVADLLAGGPDPTVLGVLNESELAAAPAVPWDCKVRPPTQPNGLTCLHPGPIAAGESTTLALSLKLGSDPSIKSVANCAAIVMAKGDPSPMSCVTGPVEQPPSGLGTGPKTTKNGLEVNKSVADPGTCSSESCAFAIAVRNTTAAPMAGPIKVVDLPMGGTPQEPKPFRTALLAGPDAPWTCKPQPGAEQVNFECTHPGPLAAGATSILKMTVKLVDAKDTPNVMNCALVDEETGSCVTVANKVPPPPPPPPPPDPNGLELVKRRAADKCSDLGGGCAFTVSITNSSAKEFNGPIEFTDIFKTADGKALPDAALEAQPLLTLPDGAVAAISCAKAGEVLTCGTGGASAKIPAGKTIVARLTMRPGPANGATAVRNCARLKSGGGDSCSNMALINGPLLRLTKFGGGDTCLPRCTFAVVVQNVGNKPASGAFKFKDTFTPATSLGGFNTAPDGAECAQGDGALFCVPKVKVLNPGELTTVTVTVFGTAKAPEYTNCVDFVPQPQAPADKLVLDDKNEGRCVTVKDTSPQTPNLVIRKRAPNTKGGSDGHCELKSACRFTIEITNNGLAPFTGPLRVTDTVSNGVPQFIAIGPGSPQSLPWSCSSVQNGVGAPIAQSAITCELPPLPNGLAPGTTAALEVAVTPGATWKGSDTLRNCVEITSAGDIGANAVKADCASAILDPFNVEVAKTGDQSCEPGGDCKFRISLFNPGPIDHNAPVTISDELTGLSSAQIVSITPPLPCATQPTQVPFSCTTPGNYPLPLGPNGEPRPPKTFDMVIRLPSDASAAQFSNCASASNPSGETRSQSCVTVQSQPVLRKKPIAKTAVSASCNESEPCAFKVTITNTLGRTMPGPIVIDDLTTIGGVAATQIALSREVEAPWVCVASAAAGMQCSYPDSLPVNASVDLNLSLQPLPGSMGAATEVENCATIQGIRPGMATACASIPIQATKPATPENACFGGMVFANGACACPSGTKWNGKTCAGTGGINITKPAPAPLPVLEPPAATCAPGMVLVNDACACPPGTKLKGKICDGTGGINKTAPLPKPDAPAPAKAKPAPVKCGKNQVLDKAQNRCVAAKPVKCRDNQVLDRATGKCVVRKERKVCPADRPVGRYPNCCPEGTEFRRGKCRRSVQEQEQQEQREEQRFCEGDRPNGIYPNCCPFGAEFRRGRCRRIEVEQPQPQTEQPVDRDCGPGYRVLKRPNKYGSYCELIPVQGPDPTPSAPQPKPQPTPTCDDDEILVNGRCRSTQPN